MAPTPTETKKKGSNLSDETLLTKDFLQKVLNQELRHGRREDKTGQEIVSHKVSFGTKPGDNYTSIIYTIDVELDTKKNSKKRHLFLKCYPSHPQRQLFNNKTNMFWKELEIYS
jgi:hypothetical protein